MENDKFVNIRMNPELHLKFKVYCVQHQVTMADMVKELVEEALKD